MVVLTMFGCIFGQRLSEIVRVSERLFLALVITYAILREQTLRGNRLALIGI